MKMRVIELMQRVLCVVRQMPKRQIVVWINNQLVTDTATTLLWLALLTHFRVADFSEFRKRLFLKALFVKNSIVETK